MTKIVFKHHRDTQNLGDAVCSPYDYLPDLAAQGIAVDLAKPTPEADVVIYGGGKIMGGVRRAMGPNDLATRYRIAWGVSTVQSSPISLKYWRAFRAMTLVGTRDWSDKRFDFAPCTTCLSPNFDLSIEPTHDVVLYLHHWKSDKQGVARPEGVPTLANNAPSFEKVVRHLGSGRVVVSNSYHGVYWGLLLGRKVLCLPFSNKFQGYRIAPGYANATTWPDHIDQAKGSDEMLGICREATEQFHSKVRDLIAA